MSIRTATRPNNIGTPRVDFNQPTFDNLVFDKGYNVILHEAVRCPCNAGREGAQMDCNNCLGTGWVFVNPIRTKAIITSINKDTKYKYWAAELSGTVAVTVRDGERLSVMDKIILEDRTSLYGEIRDLRTYDDGTRFIFTTYPIDEVESVFLYDEPSAPLIRINKELYSISEDNPYVLKLDSSITLKTTFNGVVSVKYKHKLQYNVQDLPHDVRYTTYLNSNGKEEDLPLPIQAVAVKTENINGNSVLYTGGGLIDNSYL